MRGQLLPNKNSDNLVLKNLSTVLVSGGHNCAARLAERLCEEGFSVTYLGKIAPNVPKECLGKIQHIPDGTLKAITGVIGAFHASIESLNGVLETDAGFVAVAEPSIGIPKFDVYGVKPAEGVVSLSDFLHELKQGEIGFEKQADLRHIAFFVGLDGASETETFARVFDCIDMLVAHGRVQCHVFTRHVKVAEKGLEARYRRIRELGTIFYAFEKDYPLVEQTIHGVKILFSDPNLATEFELNPHLLVIDERRLSPRSVDTLSTILPSSFTYKPYLTPESPRYPSVLTPKVGVFALGAARGEFYTPKIEDDIELVVGTIKNIIRLGEVRDSGLVAEVEPSTCTLCLTCVRICPHGAIDFGVSARVDAASCLGCGVCACECPMQAIVLTPKKTSSYNGSVAEPGNLQIKASQGPKTVAFLCEHSAASAFKELPHAFKAAVSPIVVSCAGAVGEIDIIQAFLNGADGVMVAGCFRGNCNSVYGTNRAEHRVARVQEILVEAGLKPDRVLFVPSACNTPNVLALAIEKLVKRYDSTDVRETKK